MLSGWIVTFVIDERHGGSSSGYLTTGFFAGLTLGRIVLLWVNKKVRYLHAYSLLMLIFSLKDRRALGHLDIYCFMHNVRSLSFG